MRPSRPMYDQALHISLALAVGLLVAAPACAQEEPVRPLLSEALRAALAKEPPDSVEKRFVETLKSGSSTYDFDAEGINALGVEYMQKGETEKGMAVMAVAAHAAQVMMAGLMPPELAAAAAAEQAGQRERERRARPPTPDEEARRRGLARLGPPRHDLERFHGVFGNDADRMLFIVRTCDGHLRIGAMWGDVAPWALRSLADTRFQHPGDDFTEPFHVEIATGPDGRATGITHGLTFIASPLPRRDDLPDGWAPQCQ